MRCKNGFELYRLLVYNGKKLLDRRGIAVLRAFGALSQDRRMRYGALSIFLFAPLLPEWLAPLTTLFVFILFFRYARSQAILITPRNQQILAVIFLCWQFSGIPRSNYRISSLVFSLLWLLMFLGFLTVSNLLTDEGSLRDAVVAITLCGGIVGCIAVGQIFLFHFGGYINESLRTFFNPFWGKADVFLADIAVNHLLPDKTLALLPVHAPVQAQERANSTFSNPIFLACYSLMVLPLSVYCFSNGKTWKKKLISAVCVVACVGGIAASYSRGAYLSVIVVVFVMLFMGWKQALGIVVASPVFLWLFPSGVYRRLLSLLNLRDFSVVTRSRIWEICIALLKEHWVWGLGPGVENIRHILIERGEIHQPHAHNLVLQLFLEGGIIGIALFVAVIIWTFIDLIVVCFRSKKGRPLAAALIAGLTGLLVFGFFDYVLYGAKILQFFMMYLGLAMAVKSVYGKKRKTADAGENPEPTADSA